jgi:hypothetical protein
LLHITFLKRWNKKKQITRSLFYYISLMQFDWIVFLVANLVWSLHNLDFLFDFMAIFPRDSFGDLTPDCRHAPHQSPPGATWCVNSVLWQICDICAWKFKIHYMDFINHSRFFELAWSHPVLMNNLNTCVQILIEFSNYPNDNLTSHDGHYKFIL